MHIINPLNAKLNPICRLLALLGAHLIFHVSGLRVNVHLEHCIEINTTVIFTPLEYVGGKIVCTVTKI